VRQVEALITRVEARQHKALNGEQGRKRLADAHQALEHREISAARAALLEARRFLEIAEDEASLARALELERAVEAAEASRTSADALREAAAALALADFASAKAAAAAARTALVKAACSCGAVDAIDARIQAGQHAHDLQAEAHHLLDCASKRARDDELADHHNDVEQQLVLARAVAEKFLVAQAALRELEPLAPAGDALAARQGDSDGEGETAGGLAALLHPGWRDEWHSRVNELMALLAWRKDVQEQRRGCDQLLARAHDAFQKDDLDEALKLAREAGEIAGKMAGSSAQQVEQEGLRLATDAEYLATRVEAAMADCKAADEVGQALQAGEELLKEDKLAEARAQESRARALLATMRQDEGKVEALGARASVLGKAIARAEAAEAADLATSLVRDCIEAADFDGARAAVMKAAEALQRCEMADHEAVVLKMLSHVNLAEQLDAARRKALQLLAQAEAALEQSDEAAARRGLEAALQALDGVGRDAVDPDMRRRLDKLEEALSQLDEASRAAADARQALSKAEQLLAAEQDEQARQSLQVAGDAIEEAAALGQGRPDMAEQLEQLRHRHAQVSQGLARGAVRGEARRAAGQHHAAAQRALGAQDAATATTELGEARRHYQLAGDLSSMGPVLDALEQQIADLLAQRASLHHRAMGDEAVTRFGEAVVKADFELARSLLDEARAHYAAASVDMSEVLAGLEAKMRAAEANAAKHTVADESLQLAIEQVAEGNLQEAREALDIAKQAYKAAGVQLMDDAIRDLEADINAELAKASGAAGSASERQRQHGQGQGGQGGQGCGAAGDGGSDSESSSSSDSQASLRPRLSRAAGKGRERGVWRQAFDPASNDVYYFHSVTKETQVQARGPARRRAALSLALSRPCRGLVACLSCPRCPRAPGADRAARAGRGGAGRGWCSGSGPPNTGPTTTAIRTACRSVRVPRRPRPTRSA